MTDTEVMPDQNTALPCADESAAVSAIDTKPSVSARPRRSILLLIDQLCELGGGERAAFQLAQELPRYGFRVIVVTLRSSPDPEAYWLCDNLVVLPLTSSFGLQAVRVARDIRALIRQERIDIVQTFFESADTLGTVIAHLSGVPYIVSSRRDMGILRNLKHRLAYRLLGGRFNKVIAVSAQVSRWHRVADHLHEEQMCVIHNGLLPQKYEPMSPSQRDSLRHELLLPCDVPLVLTIANINRWKGLDVFLDAAAVVLKAHGDAVFAIAGAFTDAALVEELRIQAAQLGIADRVYLLGRIVDVAPLLLASDIFVLLSRTEGFPNVVLEAMAARLSVVATAVGGTPEAVVENVTGFLVPQDQAHSAANSISLLLSQPRLRARMGEAGRTRVEETFSLKQMIEKHVELYDTFPARPV